MRFEGRNITGWRPDRITGVGLVRTFQIARGFPRLSVLENLLLYGTAQPGERLVHAVLRSPAARRREAELRERARAIAQRLNLARVLDHRAADLSGGQKKLLEIGRALMARADAAAARRTGGRASIRRWRARSANICAGWSPTASRCC